MLDKVQLYIGDQEVELGDASILYNYTVNELQNPTVVKNSFSKTITILGSPINNQIFGHYWNLERQQGNGATASGVYFNASKKAPFKLYVNADIYEQGYAKLDDIQKNKTNDYIYKITLYGGLGDFFYNLSMKEDGTELKLSDLDYYTGGTSEFNFTINMDTVKQAWEDLSDNRSGMWQHINFVPAYNGYPDDFDADKCVINLDKTNLTIMKDEDGKRYYSKSGFVIGELPNEMTEWEIRDLRSYNQRPCIRVKSMINAFCDSNNNGGYNVVLDPDFFNVNNPYYESTWMTLPSISSLEYSSGEQVIEGATLITGATSGSVDNLMAQPLTLSIGDFGSSIPSSISVKCNVDVNSTYANTSNIWFWNWNGDSYHTGNFCLGSLYVQLVALNGDTIVGASQTYNLTTPVRHNGKLYYGHSGRYGTATYNSSTGKIDCDGGHNYVSFLGKPIYDMLGVFGYGGFKLENQSTPYQFEFKITGLNSNITELRMIYYWGATSDKVKKTGVNAIFSESEHSSWITPVRTYQPILMSGMEIPNISSDIKAVLGVDNLGRTGTQVSKALLLNTEATPCDYLLAYTKMFGLYFRKDIYTNTVYIDTRKTFYQRDNVVNLNDFIDYSKAINITPITFDKQWYQFIQEQYATDFYNRYKTAKGLEFGSKLVNTGYEFNTDKKNLLEGTKIKGGIEGLERSKFFVQCSNDNIRPWFDGMTYNLYNEDSTIEIAGKARNGGTVVPINEDQGMKYYDLFPKLQFRDKDNKASDGNNVLCFFSGFKSLTDKNTPTKYILSDDNFAQTMLNDGKPCWLLTANEYWTNIRLCYNLNQIPVFERYYTNNNSTRVIKSLDFGTPQEIYVPNYSLTDESNIYSNFWRTYITDLYDVNTKILTCYVRVQGKPNTDWMRRFYWFDNCIWRLNKIVDWNVTGDETTKMEFVKVQDTSNYTSQSQISGNTISITPETYVVPLSGKTINIGISIKSGGAWRIITPNTGITFSQTTGVGDAVITADIAPNASSRDFYITAISNQDAIDTKATISQNGGGPVAYYINVEPLSKEFNSTGGTATLTITSNIDWTIWQ